MKATLKIKTVVTGCSQPASKRGISRKEVIRKVNGTSGGGRSNLVTLKEIKGGER